MGDWVLAGLTGSSESVTFDSTLSISDRNDGDSPEHHGPLRVGEQSHLSGFASLNTGRVSSARSSFVHVSTAGSTQSSGSQVSCASSTHSKSGSTSIISASEASKDPILQNFAQRTASPPRQNSRSCSNLAPSSVSSPSTNDENDNSFCSTEHTSATPPTTSSTLPHENLSINLDLDDPHWIEIIPRNEALNPVFTQNDNLLFPHGPTDFLEDIDNITHEGNLGNHAITLSEEAGGHSVVTDGKILGLPLGPLHTEACHPNAHRQIQGRGTQEETNTITTNGDTEPALFSEQTYVEQHDVDEVDFCYAVAQKPTTEYWQNGRTGRRHDIPVEIWRRALQRFDIWGSIDCASYSVETLSSVFYPDFAFQHLSPPSVEKFQTELIAPDGLLEDTECEVSLFLGFGPLVQYRVCVFVPNNREALKSYRKRAGEEDLQKEESLPIFINLYSPGFGATDVDAWLDMVIDDDDHFLGYLELMQRKQKESPSVQILMNIVRWYMSSKENPLKKSNDISRVALKLLMTTSLLTLVPKVNGIPPSIHQRLSPQPSQQDTKFSPVAPKLLSRQIKTSIHYLQRDLLHALFYYLSCDLQFAEGKVAIALLIAFVLELAQKAGQEFARFANQINSSVRVKPEDVVDYEARVKTHVFGTLRASVCGLGQLGQLSDLLRSFSSMAKGKGVNSGQHDCQYVKAILNTVL